MPKAPVVKAETETPELYDTIYMCQNRANRKGRKVQLTSEGLSNKQSTTAKTKHVKKKKKKKKEESNNKKKKQTKTKTKTKQKQSTHTPTPTHADTIKQRKVYMTLIWADDAEAGVDLAPASGSVVRMPGEGLYRFTVTITT